MTEFAMCPKFWGQEVVKLIELPATLCIPRVFEALRPHLAQSCPIEAHHIYGQLKQHSDTLNFALAIFTTGTRAAFDTGAHSSK